jgi:hypothetical protein
MLTMTDQNPSNDTLAQAYQNMMTRIKTALSRTREETLPNLQQQIDAAVDKAIELEELTDEEARRMGDYLRRDVQDAAEFLVNTRQELGDWLGFDVALVEDKLLDMFSHMVDHTREELDKLAQQARAASEWHTGEVTGPGTLRCEGCGKEISFHKPSRIPPCPHCHQTLFKLIWEETGEATDAR